MAANRGGEGNPPSGPPRDRLGRPLPPGAQGFPGITPRADVDEATTIDEALTYLAEGLPFHAHEVLEQRWRCCPLPERPLWRSLAQAAAGLTHEARGNTIGAARLHERAVATFSVYDGEISEPLTALLSALHVAD